MSVISLIGGTGIPLRGKDIDTDRIIPARFLRCVTFDGLDAHVFADDRSQLKAAGSLHPFDNPEFSSSKVLIAGSNFGCGSSREHAPQALFRWGVRAVVAESFAEIFFNNTLAIGMPCVCLTAADISRIQTLVENDPSLNLTVDLEALELRIAHQSFTARIPAAARSMFLAGQWDASTQLLQNLDMVKRLSTQIPYLNGFSS